MIEHIVFWGLCAILVFVPLPIGSVEEWAVFVFEAATIGLFLLYVGGRLFGGGKEKGRVKDAGRDVGRDGAPEEGAGRLPLFFKILIGIFLAVSFLQIVPLPAGVVEVLSPRAYAVYAGLARDGITAPASWLTLSFSPGASVAELTLMMCYGLFGFLVLRTVRSRRQVEIFVLVMLASALFQAFYGMAETFSGHEMIFGTPKRHGLGSVTGTYVNRNHFAGFLEMAFPLSLGYLLVKARYFAMEKGLSLRRKFLWFGQERLQWTLLLGLVPVFIGLGLVFSKSRSGIMVLAVTAVLAAAAASSWREFSEETGHEGGGGRRFGRIVRVVVMVVLAAAVWLGIGPVIERFSEVDISTEGRKTFYENTVEMIGDYPWTGTGKGTYVNAYPIYEKVDDRLRLSFAHNDYLEFTAENGVVGGGALVLAGIGLAVWMAAMWRRRRGSFAKGIGLGALLAVVAILIHAFTDFNLQIPANAVYFTALAMLGASILGGKGKGEEVEGDEADEEDEGESAEGDGGETGDGPGGAKGGEQPKVKGPKKGDAFRKSMSLVRMVIAGALGIVLLIAAWRDFWGFEQLGRYRRARSEARSVESAFPGLEARLKKAVASSPRSVFRVELAHLYMEMARVANDAGREEERDTYCDKAVASYGNAIAADPIEATTYYDTAAAYLFYNFPLMTYQDRAKSYFHEALVFKPADETINLNVIFLYFSWWPTLEDAEKAYAAGLYRAMVARDPLFPAKLETRWTQSYGSLDGLRSALTDATNK